MSDFDGLDESAPQRPKHKLNEPPPPVVVEINILTAFVLVLVVMFGILAAQLVNGLLARVLK